MAQKKLVIQSGAWQMLNAGVKIFSQFAYYAVMARLLSKAELGIFALLNSFMNFGNMMGDGGMGDALVQRKQFDKQHINAAFYSSVGLALLIYAIIFLISPWAADFYGEPQLTSSLRIFSIIFLFAAMYSASFAVLQKKFAFKKIFIADGVMLFLSNILGVVLAYYKFGVMSLVYSQLFYFGAELIILLYYQPIPLKLGFTKKHFKDLIGYSTGLTLIRFNTYIVNFGIILEVGKLVKTVTLGVFDRSFRIMNIPQRFLYDVIQRVMMPAMVKKTDTPKGTYTAFSRTFSFVTSLLLPLTVFLIIFSKPVVLILLGKRWLDAVIMLQIFFLNLPIRTVASLGDTLMRVHGLIRLNLIRKAQNSVIICVLIYIGFKLDGVIGISWSIFASTFISYVMMMFIIKNRIFPKDWKKLIFRPYYNGIIITICWVLPLYPLSLAINAFIKNEIISFVILCGIAFLVALFAFVKKPALLGSDVAYIQKDFIQMFKKKTKMA